MPRTSWQIMSDTIYALFFRELKTRFGSTRLGYFWALAGPALSSAIIAIFFTLLGRGSLSGVPVFMFMLTGFIPFGLYSSGVKNVSAALSANKGLLGYRQVTPMDPIITRFGIELITTLLVFLILAAFLGWLSVDILAWMRIDAWPDNFLGVFFALVLLALLALGIGLTLAIAELHWEGITQIYSLFSRPLIFVSGVFYAVTMIPEQYWFLLSWNPILHAIELVRDAYFVAYETPIGSWSYLLIWVVFTNLIGLMLYRVSRDKLVSM